MKKKASWFCGIWNGRKSSWACLWRKLLWTEGTTLVPFTGGWNYWELPVTFPPSAFPMTQVNMGFHIDPQQDTFICPMGQSLAYHRLNCNKSTGKYLRCYQVQGDVCQKCTSRKTCFDTTGVRRRILASSCYPAFYRGHLRVNTPEYLCMMRKRKIWAEGSFAVMKREHNLLKIQETRHSRSNRGMPPVRHGIKPQEDG